MLILDWRSGKLHPHRDPPFQRPPQPAHDEEEAEEEDEDASYEHVPPVRRTSAGAPTRYDNSEAPQSPFADPQQQQRYLDTGSTPYTPAVHQQPLAGRPSMDAYGAFDDPAPSGFGTAHQGYSAPPAGAYSPGYATASPSRQYSGPPILPEPDMGGPMVSRTMQYADPYAAVRASIAGPASPTAGPPSYDSSYQGYR